MKPESPLGDSGPLLGRALDLVSGCPGLVPEREIQVTLVTCVPAAFFLVLLAVGQCYSLPHQHSQSWREGRRPSST